ncbi:hypothetical protein EY643_17055 [Halioglobus maricola]|uniref:NADP-dependent oxidoreductase domain-containing protein n=1 Tax=Halioglobus maricola TaxID=2601894 RepID=A0A5P9NQR4_9GAMM|nr:aldo/keto reductase [Halioglobus maricola]QFU77228.1 hypothetical protein EY643_17055 [Halioglobus maricola]
MTHSPSRLIYGCMRLPTHDLAACRQILQACLDVGINHFDQADIYGGGQCEKAFGDTWKHMGVQRHEIVLTSKCGIVLNGQPHPASPKRYDFSRAHIVTSVENSLRRLDTDYLDQLLLHRPDFLMDPHEVAEAFSQLQQSGKVRNFGVSNFTRSQVDLLNGALQETVIAHQSEFSLLNLKSLEDGTLDQCMAQGIQYQAWSPLAGSFGEATDSQRARLQQELVIQAEKYQLESWLVALAWVLKHPARIHPLLGTTRPERILSSISALEIDYHREDWYALLEASRGVEVA